MKFYVMILGAVLVLTLAGLGHAAYAHETMDQGMQGQGQSAGHAGSSMMTSGQGMMGQGMARGMMSGMMGQGMMGQGMMHGMMGGGAPGKGHHFGRVRPAMHLSVDDVRHHFEHYLEWRGNDRLQVGKVEAKDDDTIVADIETVDASLVEQFDVDRHTGLVSRANQGQ